MAGFQISRLGDIDTGHGGFPPRAIITASTDVFVENKGVARATDRMAVHCNSTPTCHDGFIASGSSGVFANNLAVARVGDPVSCGGTLATGASRTPAG